MLPRSPGPISTFKTTGIIWDVSGAAAITPTCGEAVRLSLASRPKITGAAIVVGRNSHGGLGPKRRGDEPVAWMRITWT
jgi:hypothetical protein